MAKVPAHGTVVGTGYFTTSAKRYMSDGTILVNHGHGWKAGGKIRDGMTPLEALERQQAKQDEVRGQFPAAFAYRKMLHDTCGMATRWQLHYAITLMPDDPDGVWSDVCGDGYGRVHADIGEVVRLCGLYRLAVKESATVAA